MKKVQIIQKASSSFSPVELEDFSQFETKMIAIKQLKEIKQSIDKSLIVVAIDALKLQGEKITPKRVKKICKEVLTQMIEEVEK